MDERCLRLIEWSIVSFVFAIACQVPPGTKASCRQDDAFRDGLNNTKASDMARRFQDRTDAGRLLAKKLGHYASRKDIIVLGMPRGGVPVAFEVAKSLRVPWDVFIVRKLGVPGHEELAMGAIASGGIRVLNETVIRSTRVSEEIINSVTERERIELERRELAYRGHRPVPLVRDKIVILVDDGVATGSTMLAAAAALRHQQPARIVVAAPAAPIEFCANPQRAVDEVVVVVRPDPFYSVGHSYEIFGQTSDEEVQELLRDTT
jgi:putative phosphoribosyl transferase